MFNHAQNGQKAKIDANLWNQIQDTTRRNLEQKLSSTSKPEAPIVPHLDCKNETGRDLPQFSIVGVDDAMIRPGTNETDFYYQPTVVGVVP